MATELTGLFATPAQPLSGRERIARALMGFGAGVEGRGAETAAFFRQQDQALSLERQQAMAQDAMRVTSLLGSGRSEDALKLIDNRIEQINKLGGDPSDTLGVRNLIASGNSAQALQEIGAFLTAAQQRGIIKLPEQQSAKVLPASSISETGQVATQDPRTGELSLQTIPGFQAAPVKENYNQPFLADGSPNPAFQDYQRSLRAAGAPTTNVNVPGEARGIAKLEEGLVESFLPLVQQAETSAAVVPQLQTLRQLAGATTEGLTGQLMSQYFPTFSDPNTAYSSLVSQILPSMRAPGSGAQSDRDIDVLQKGIGGLGASREVKMLVIDSLIRKNDLIQQKADLTERLVAGEITPREALRERRKIDTQSILPDALQSRLNAVIGENSTIPPAAAQNGITPDLWNTMSPEEQQAFK